MTDSCRMTGLLQAANSHNPTVAPMYCPAQLAVQRHTVVHRHTPAVTSSTQPTTTCTALQHAQNHMQHMDPGATGASQSTPAMCARSAAADNCVSHLLKTTGAYIQPCTLYPSLSCMHHLPLAACQQITKDPAACRPTVWACMSGCEGLDPGVQGAPHKCNLGHRSRSEK